MFYARPFHGLLPFRASDYTRISGRLKFSHNSLLLSLFFFNSFFSEFYFGLFIATPSRSSFLQSYSSVIPSGPSRWCFPLLEHFPYTHMLIKTLLNIEEGLPAGLRFSLHVALFFSALSPANTLPWPCQSFKSSHLEESSEHHGLENRQTVIWAIAGITALLPFCLWDALSFVTPHPKCSKSLFYIFCFCFVLSCFRK